MKQETITLTSAPLRARGDDEQATAVERLPTYKALTYILGATVLVYANAIGGEFVFDDTKQILSNDQLKSWGNVLHAFVSNVWSFQANLPTNDLPPLYYRPLFTVYLTVCYQLFGLWPQGWHLMSIAVHALATACVFFLLRRLAKNQFVAITGTVIFGLHPAHTESVAWISAIPDPMLVCFFAPALLCYDKFRCGEGRNYLYLSLGAFLLALLCKETALILPVIIAIWELFFRLGALKERAKSAVLVLVPYGLISIGYLAARVAVLGELGSRKHPAMLDTPDRLIWMSVPFSLVSYVKHLLWPFHLSIVYGTSFVKGASDVNFWLPVLILVVLVSALVGLRQRLPHEARLALVLIFAPLVPVLNLRVFHQEYMVQDRYLYLSVVGLGWLCGLVLLRLRQRPRLPLLALVLLACVLGGETAWQNRVWASHVALWTRALDYAPSFWSIHYNLGMGYLEKRRPAEAYDEFVRAAEIDKRPNIYNEMALAQLDLGDKEGAQRSLRQAIALDPTLVEAKTNMGVLLYDQGHYRDAAKQFAEVVVLDPRVREAHFNLARAAGRLGDHQLAAREYELVVAKNPDDAEARAGLAESYEALGRHDEAIAQSRLARAGKE